MNGAGTPLDCWGFGAICRPQEGSENRVTISVSPTGSQGARGLLPEGFRPRAATALRRRTC